MIGPKDEPVTTYKAGWISLDLFMPVLGQWDPSVRWNGWLCPSIDALSVVEVLDGINAENGEPVYLYDWTDEGYLMLVELEDPDGGVEFLRPDEDGLYPLGSMAWIWSEMPWVMGVFHAVRTRDATALAHDGKPFLDLHPVREDGILADEEGDLFEIRFADGLWILATSADLDFSTVS